MIIRNIKNHLKPFLQAITGDRIVWRQKSIAKSVYLTFDDGPHPIHTPMLLDLLDNFNIKGTFFLVGEQVDKFPALAKEIVQRGHQVGSHSFYHGADIKKGIKDYDIEIKKCIEVIYRATGQRTNLFRPPWGTITTMLLAHCVTNGIRIILWSYDSLDFEKELNIRELDVSDGDIVLLHDDAIYCINILTKEVPRLIKRGFVFESIQNY